jgi:hypothetical protein
MNSQSPDPKKQGFALIVSLMLMAFILLLAISLSSILSVEFHNSANAVERERARMNALLGLHIALGELQQAAGADQRITATSFIHEVNVSNLQDSNYSQPMWTEVWSTIAEYDENGESDNWPVVLVSGNSPQPQTGPDANRAITLVGEGSLGSMITDDKRIVKAEKTDIANISGNVVGSYAWWVGDEGVKASLTTDLEESDTPWLNPYRFGLDMLYPELSLFYTQQSENGQYIANYLSSLGQANIQSDDIKYIITEEFHNITLRSNNLMTDVVNGGFRKNLTAALSSSGTEDETAFNNLLVDPLNCGGQQIFPPQQTGIATTSPSEPDPGGPYWKQLASFFQKRVSSGADAQVAVRPHSNSQTGVFPVLQSAQVYFYAGLTPAPNGDYYIRYMVSPIITIWNPYNVSLNYEGGRVEFMNGLNGNYPVFYAKWQENGVEQVLEAPSGSGSSEYGSNGSWENQIKAIFMLPDMVLAPGEAKIFTAAKNQAYDRTDNQLSEGYNAGFGFYNDYDNSSVPIEGTDSSGNPTQTVVGISFYRSPQNGMWNLWANGHDFTTNIDPEGELIQQAYIKYALTLGPATSSLTSTNNVWTKNSDGSYKYFEDEYIPDVITSDTDPAITNFPAVGYKTTLHLPESSAVEDIINTNNVATVTASTIQQYPWLQVCNPRAAQLYGSSQWNVSYPYQVNVTIPTVAYEEIANAQTAYYKTYDDENGSAYTGYSDVTGITNQALFDLPRTDIPIYSIGEFSQAPLSVPITEEWTQYRYSGCSGTTAEYTRSYSWSLAYAIGNSWADARIPANGTYAQYSDNEITYDLSYLLNEALWDHYFLTGKEIDNSSFGRVQPQPGVSEDDSNLDSYDEAGPLLFQSGAFNVNSTSINAWKTFIASTWGTELPNTSDGDSLAPLLRHWYPNGSDAGSGGGSIDNASSNFGYRRLTETEISNLAEQIVLQVKQRGPFLSVADFVNRSLNSSNSELQRVGTLQTAINNSGINTDLEQPDVDSSVLDDEIFDKLEFPNAFQGAVATGIPGYLTQADVLARVGPAIAVRSDTYTIRSYGSSTHPITGETVAQAWVEATIQRTPTRIVGDTLDTGTGAEDDFGRRFQIISIRWLNENEI